MVMLLHRKGSNFPFITDVIKTMQEQPLQLVGSTVSVPANDFCDQLFPVGFTTIFDYLFLLREACQSIENVGANGIVFLAAAVSDFYIPEGEMVSEKIQSRSHDGLAVQLRNVPKLLGAVKHWAPQSLVVSFKLETNPNILLAKAVGALKKYGVDAVCSNLLHTYRDCVTIIMRDSQASGIEVASGDIKGDETEPIMVQGVATTRIERGANKAIDGLLVGAIIDIHDGWVGIATETVG